MAINTITDLSETGNDNIDMQGANVAENCAFSGINNAIRNLGAMVAEGYNRLTGHYQATGSSGTYAVTTDSGLSAYVTGERYSFRANHTTPGASSLNIDSLGAKTIKKMGASGKADTASGDIQSGQSVTVEYDGTDLLLVTPRAEPTAESLNRGWVLVTTKTANNTSGNLDFTGLDNTYAAYMFELEEILPATDNVDLLVRVSADNGTSFLATASYQYRRATANPGSDTETIDRTGTGTSFRVAGGIGNGSTEGARGYVDIHRLGNSGLPFIQSDIGFTDATTAAFFFTRARGVVNTSNTYNAVRFTVSAGAIASGTIRCFGLRKS